MTTTIHQHATAGERKNPADRDGSIAGDRVGGTLSPVSVDGGFTLDPRKSGGGVSAPPPDFSFDYDESLMAEPTEYSIRRTHQLLGENAHDIEAAGNGHDLTLAVNAGLIDIRNGGTIVAGPRWDEFKDTVSLDDDPNWMGDVA